MRVPWPLRVLLALFVGALLIQLVPYGRDHDNPAVVREPAWSSDEARALVVGACFDCHSNETKWPWYSNIAPQSWLVQRDVDRGRAALNFSEWPPEDDEDDLADPVEDGDMPPWQYRLMHPDARLSAAEKAALIAELEAIAESEGDGDDNSGSGSEGDNSGPGSGDA